jgi:serine/threonine protein kinase
MTAALDCPEPASWRALFDDDLSPEQRARYERHLESCPACQERLDQDGLCEDPLRQIVRRVGDPTATPDDPTLREFLGRLHEVTSPLRAAAAAPADLYLLTPTDRPDLLGTLGNYEVQEVIGRGGMGVVLKAFDPALHRTVAIKVMAMIGSATARTRFAREAKAAAAVCHENVVTIHGVHEADGLPYLVMQYVAGESLQARLDRAGPLDVIEVVRIGMQTASGLAAAHAQGLIHRDIKPANLLLEDGSARVKITDFGLARLAADVPLTQAGVVAGTPEYMAPEQARGEEIDHRADLFSLGSVLYAACTGAPPFRDSSAKAVLRHVSSAEPQPVRELRPEVPAWLEEFIMRLMAKEPGRRFQTAAEVAGLLEGYLAHLREPVAVPVPELDSGPAEECSFSPVGGRWHRLARPLGLILCVLALGLLALVVTRPWAGGAPAGPAPLAEPVREYSRSFKGNTERTPELTLHGPDAEQYVHFEPEGLRITLPVGHEGPRPGNGLTIGLSVRGDFDITVSYEILQEPEQADAGTDTTRFSLDAGLDRSRDSVATISRRMTSKHGADFLTWLSLWRPETNQLERRGQEFPALASEGKLRLARTGSVISYYAADGRGEEFKLLRQSPFSVRDLEDVKIVALTGGSRASLDVRITDVQIHADALLSLVSAPAPLVEKQTSKGWLAAGGLAGLLLTLALLIPLGAWVRARRSSGPGATAPPVLFRCPDCGKNLRIKAESAGKQARCPQCGKAVEVPSAATPTPAAAQKRSRARIVGLPLGATALLVLALVAGWAYWTPRLPRSGMLNVTLGRELVPGVEELGFYHQEYDYKSRPFRWTDGNARLAIPVDAKKPPQALVVEVLTMRPPGVDTVRLRIVANKTDLFDARVAVGPWEKTFDLAGIDLGEELVVQIVSDTFVPLGVMEGGANRDPRTLGVEVRGVTPIRREQAE